VQGDVLERQGPETLYVNEAIFTTCDGSEPSWSLKATNLLVNRGGLAVASGVSFSNKYFPMFYLPYFMVPIKNERQTGFLIPSLGNSSRDGFFAAAPFFWELAEDYDLTILPFYRSKRGLALTLEGRYNFNAGQGIWIMTHLHDKQDNIYTYLNPNGPTRNSKDLYWLRAQNSWTAGEWNLNLDLDIVSDPLFLYAFRSDLDGFWYSQRLFSEYFGRTVNEELDPTRLSTFFAQKVGKDTYFRGSLTYTDNLYRRNNIDTLQNLPRLQYNIVSRPLKLGLKDGDSFFNPRFSLDAQYDYYSRKSNQYSSISETGHRLHLSPQFFFNHSLGKIFTVKTNTGLYLTSYTPSGLRPSEFGSTNHSGFEQDLSGNFDLELSTSLSRIFYSNDPQGAATLHQLNPVLSLEIVEAPSQEELPYWDMLDRRLNRRTLRYGIRNTLTYRNPVYDPDGGLIRYDYSQLLKIGLYSSYEFASNITWAQRDWARYYTTGYFEDGVGPFEIEIESNLVPGMSTRLLSSLDGRTGRFTRHEISMNLRDTRGDSLVLLYDYDNPSLKQGPTLASRTISQIRGDAAVNFSGGFSANFSTRYDFEKEKELETYISLNYSDQCYGVSLLYSNSDDDKRIGLVIDLLGLGSFGTPTTRLSSTENY
jgi:LPS-assembly protein